MKAKVIKKFRDKNTKKVFDVGSVYEGSEERLNQIQKKGFLEIEKPKKKKTTKEGE